MREQEIDMSMPNVPVATAMPIPDYGHHSASSSAPPPVAVATAVGGPAAGSAMTAPSFRTPASNQLDRDQISALQRQGFPLGLAQELGNTVTTYPLRFWVVDNSGSMRTNDGHQLRGSSDAIRVVDCNRYVELVGSVVYHAELAGLLRATTVFRLLNDPGSRVGPQEFSVAEANHSNGGPATKSSIEHDVQQVRSIMERSEPIGVTPLTEHILAIRQRLSDVAPTLRAQGQKAVIVLATDGLPSDSFGKSSARVRDEFIDALRSLQFLPVWLVIRLCTGTYECSRYCTTLSIRFRS